MRIQRKEKIYADFSDLFLLSFDRAEHMRKLHKEGRYKGTSKIGIWNSSEEKRERMKNIREKNRLDKKSHGYGSEYHMRMANRTLLHNKFQGARGFMYFLEFPKTVKVGFSKEWHRRLDREITGGRVILIISGPTDDLADLEFDTLIEFQEYTKLDETGTRYTEFLDKRVKKQVYDYLIKKVKDNKNLKIDVKNYL